VPASPFFGIVIEQSLADPRFADTLDIPLRRKDPNGSWLFLIVRIAPEHLDRELERIRRALASDEPWYAHFFRGQELIAVFADAIFRVTTDEASWRPILDHGRGLGIPAEQLDFWPHTLEQAEEMLGVSLAELD
jgi:hypothetical protein